MSIQASDLLAALRQRLGDIRTEQTLGFDTDAQVDDYLESIIARSLSLAESYTHRTIVGDGTETTKIIDGNGRDRVPVPDFSELSAVKVDTTDDGEFDTELEVGKEVLAAPRDPDIAYWDLELRTTGARAAPIRCFPDRIEAVEVTAKFGWPELPGAVEEPILRLASNAFLQDQQNRRGRLTQVNEFEVEVRGSGIMTADIKRDLDRWARLIA